MRQSVVSREWPFFDGLASMGLPSSFAIAAAKTKPAPSRQNRCDDVRRRQRHQDQTTSASSIPSIRQRSRSRALTRRPVTGSASVEISNSTRPFSPSQSWPQLSVLVDAPGCSRIHKLTLFRQGSDTGAIANGGPIRCNRSAQRALIDGNMVVSDAAEIDRLV
jgi:hypothetical protein